MNASSDFRLFGSNDEQILAECGGCGRVLKVARAATTPTDAGFVTSSTIRCPCGRAASRVMPDAQAGPAREAPADAKVRCPKCRSEQFATGTQGFGLGKAAAGGLLLGPVGLLGGLFGSKKVKMTCLKCAHTWEPG